jgi:hypothetical protein
MPTNDSTQPDIPEDLAVDYRTAKAERDNPERPVAWRESMADVVNYLERIARAESALANAKAEHGKTLLALNKAAFETIPALETALAARHEDLEAVALALIGPGKTYQTAQLAMEVQAVKVALADMTAERNEYKSRSYRNMCRDGHQKIGFDFEGEDFGPCPVCQIKAENERLKAPVSDEEWIALCAGDHVDETDVQRRHIDALLSQRERSK